MFSTKSIQRFVSVGKGRWYSKVYPSSKEAVKDIKDNSTILFGGFGLCGIPENLIRALHDQGAKELIAVSNDAGVGDFGVGQLLQNKQIKRLHASYVGEHRHFAALYNTGHMEVILTPQGTLAEKLRCGGAGIPAFYTPTGVGTTVEHGQFPVKYNEDKTVDIYSKPKETRDFHGRKFVLEEAIQGDYGFLKAWKADTHGNLVFRATARNFNPDVAKAARVAIAEVEEIVEVGELKPDEIHLPGIYVDRVVKGEKYERRIERVTYAPPPGAKVDVSTPTLAARDRIGRRVAKEFNDGMYANLGIGIPTVAANYLPTDIFVELQSENGLLGMGPYPQVGEEDADIVNAGKEAITFAKGSATFCSSESFAMIRGSHIDITILGALEVSSKGDLASWIIPGQSVKGMGGAMDLLASCKRIVAAMTHTTKDGRPKILLDCDLPLTGKSVLDLIITELAVFEVERGVGLTLVEFAEGVSVEEIQAKTGCPFKISPNLKVMQQ